MPTLPPTRTVLRAEQGLSTLEYALLLVVIVIGALLVWRNLGDSLSKQMGVATERFGAMQNDGSRPVSTAIGELIRPTSTSATTGSHAARPSSMNDNGLAMVMVPPSPAAQLSPPASPAPSSAAQPSVAVATEPAARHERPSVWDRTTQYVHDSAPVQLGLGIAYGTLQAITPLGFVAPSPSHSKPFEYGRAAGEIATGLVQTASGLGLLGGGGVATVGGGIAAPVSGGSSLVLSAGGVAVAAEGVALTAQGSSNVVAGLNTLTHAMSMSGEGNGGSTSGSGSLPANKASQASGSANQPPQPIAATKEPVWTPHGGKHVASPKVPWAKVVESTKTGPAKYTPGTNVEALEREVWATGTPVTNGKSWKVMELPREVGASGGKASRWIRVEESAGTIHGHPITQAEYLKLTKTP